tara:strand:+ start:468 stop:1496 length:1029 start_codon:yes stop_codon:yes gene_type:complete
MKNILITTNTTIKETLGKLQKSSLKCLIVINQKKILLGTINDGDIRRALLKKAKTSFTIKNYYQRNCYYIKENQINNIDIKNKFKKLDINIIPIVNNDNKVISYVSQKLKNKKISKTKKVETVIMAGGLGSRLRPYTNILPKPLLPFKGKTIIENVIERFTDYGLNKFTISLNYKNILIKSFFKELKPKYNLTFLEESRPLGTAGILYKLRNKNKVYLISNCDVILNIDYIKLLKFHETEKFDITVAVSLEKDKIPYGVCEVKENKLKKIIEKPQKNYLANTGVYVVKSEIFNLIKKNENISFVNLIEKALSKNFKLGVFRVHSKTWIDLGQSVEFNRKKND